jgi:multidrug efflux pump subunit AcrA (membrane-fusion protein)
MTAKVLAIEKKRIKSNIFIPLKALFSNSTSKSLVWVVDEKRKVNKKVVITGRLAGESIEITGGLKGDEKIAISGVNLLQENDEVKAYKKLGN